MGRGWIESLVGKGGVGFGDTSNQSSNKYSVPPYLFSLVVPSRDYGGSSYCTVVLYYLARIA
jgi:hypothetical protein